MILIVKKKENNFKIVSIHKLGLQDGEKKCRL